MKLAIISHTEHFINSEGIIYGWGPTVREINFLATKFEEIVHVACIHPGIPPASSIPYSSKNIRFVPIPSSGGKTINEKLSVLTSAKEVIKVVNEVLKNVDAVQLRVPTGIANYLLPYLTFKKNLPLLWVKYAGNWNQQNAPAGYRFQRWWLINNFLKCKVTINGKWSNQPSHCFTFENPCLDEEERIYGKKVVAGKSYKGPYTASFIGRIETPKGVKRILEALPSFAQQNILTIHFIGNGNERSVFENMAKNQNQVNCIFHNSMAREQISTFLERSHFLLLPSTASEGFPKVIAEGANYGAIPIVSDISSIGQYINNKNGFVWNHKTDFTTFVNSLNLSEENLVAKSKLSYEFAGDFTFDNYYLNLKKNILLDH